MQLVSSEKKVNTPNMKTPKNKKLNEKTAGLGTPKLVESNDTPAKKKKKEANIPQLVQQNTSPLSKSQKKKLNKKMAKENAGDSPQKKAPIDKAQKKDGAAVNKNENKRKVQDESEVSQANKKSKDMQGNAKPRFEKPFENDATSVKVHFPYGLKNYKPLLLDVIKHSDVVCSSSLTLVLKFSSPEEAKKKCEIISQMQHEGKKLQPRIMMSTKFTRVIDPLKIAFRNPASSGLQPDDIKNFYGAASIKPLFDTPSDSKRPIMYVMSFKTKAEAEDAVSKKMKCNGKMLTAHPFFTKEMNNAPSTEAKETGAAQKKKTDAKNSLSAKKQKDDEEDDDDDDEEEDDDDDEEGDEDDEEGDEDDDDEEEDDDEDGDEDDDDEEEDDDDEEDDE